MAEEIKYENRNQVLGYLLDIFIILGLSIIALIFSFGAYLQGGDILEYAKIWSIYILCVALLVYGAYEIRKTEKLGISLSDNP
jgi:predicted ABC-type exoprotein transport system permease subunit